MPDKVTEVNIEKTKLSLWAQEIRKLTRDIPMYPDSPLRQNFCELANRIENNGEAGCFVKR